MAIARGSWQGALGEGTAGIEGSDSVATTLCGTDRDTVDPAGPEDQLAQVVRAPDAAVADRRDRRQRHPDEHHR